MRTRCLKPCRSTRRRLRCPSHPTRSLSSAVRPPPACRARAARRAPTRATAPRLPAACAAPGRAFAQHNLYSPPRLTPKPTKGLPCVRDSLAPHLRAQCPRRNAFGPLLIRQSPKSTTPRCAGHWARKRLRGQRHPSKTTCNALSAFRTHCPTISECWSSRVMRWLENSLLLPLMEKLRRPRWGWPGCILFGHLSVESQSRLTGRRAHARPAW